MLCCTTWKAIYLSGNNITTREIFLEIERLYNSDKVITWRDVVSFLNSDLPWPVGIAVVILTGLCVCETVLLVLFLAGLWRLIQDPKQDHSRLRLRK